MNGALIKKYREAANIKRAWLAEQLGIDETTMHRIETNQTPLTVERLYKISQLLKISIIELFDEKHLYDPDPENLDKYGPIQSNFIRFIIKQNEFAHKSNGLLQMEKKELIDICTRQLENIQKLMELLEKKNTTLKSQS